MSLLSRDDFELECCELRDVVLSEGDKAPAGRRWSGIGDGDGGAAGSFGVPRTRRLPSTRRPLDAIACSSIPPCYSVGCGGAQCGITNADVSRMPGYRSYGGWC